MKTIAPYGTWESPLSAQAIAAGSLLLDEPRIDGEWLYWIEGRPQERGRQVVVRAGAGSAPEDVTPPEANVRSRVHQYGGGAYIVHADTVYFSNYTDNRLYRQRPREAAQALTVSTALAFADCTMDGARQRLICVREDPRAAAREPVNTLVGVALATPNDGVELVAGGDFYASPRLSPDGRQLAWLAWNHPNMPWDAAELWVAALTPDGRIEAPRKVAGGAGDSVAQPRWSPAGVLHFVSERSGWWNLYREQGGAVLPLTQIEAEFAPPQWTLGQSSYGFADSGEIICSFTRNGRWSLARLDVAKSRLVKIRSAVDPDVAIAVSGSEVLVVGGAPEAPRSVLRLTLGAEDRPQLLRRAFATPLDAMALARPEAIAFTAGDGLPAHAWYYPPTHARFEAPASELPPLIVMSHGGPTSAAVATLNPKIQFWTSRGFAVVDVNYRGSSGYGRAYRERLAGEWGVADVDDCIAAAQELVRRKLADPQRLLIRGSSAGGYTTLSALTFHRVFAAGASHFGVSDIAALARDTHKFESHYLDRLVGPYPAQEELYRARSPIHHVEQLATPLILFQGLDDKIVPPAQSQTMADSLRAKGVAVAYLAFEGEGHGFRQAANIARALEAELYFYGVVLGFQPAGAIEPVAIDNAPLPAVPPAVEGVTGVAP